VDAPPCLSPGDILVPFSTFSYYNQQTMSKIFHGVVVCAVLLLTSCGKQEPSQSRTQSATSIKIASLDPSFTVQGKPFNVQPDGQAALAVIGTDIPAGAVLLWNDQPLKSGGGGSQGWVGAAVPQNLFANPGIAKLVLKAPDGALSNALEFTVFPLTGPPPHIAELNPGNAVAGKGFNLQPSGDSAIAVNGSDFLPGAKIFFGGKEMKTSFARGTSLSALVPSALATRAGSLEVWVLNPDGKSSEKVKFVIANQ
jgi:hypothetical protein